MQWNEPVGQHFAKREISNLQHIALDPDPPAPGSTIHGMTIEAWFNAAGPLVGKLKCSSLHMLYEKGEGE